MDLLQNPFHILAATTRDNRQKIMELAEERILSIDSNECIQARTDLTHPRKRLSAEIAWLPGTGLVRASEVLRYLESSAGNLVGMDKLAQFKNILGTDKMIPLAQANLLAARLSHLPDYPSDFVAAWVVSEWIVEIANVFESIDPETVHVIINEERTVSGFPAITDLSSIETEIQERRYHYRQVITSTLDKLHIKECAGAVTRVVLAATNNKEKSRLTLIEDMVDWYELVVQESLEKEERSIRVLDEKVRTAVDAKSSDTALAPMVSQLIQAVKNWGSFAQPIQIIKRSQGLSHKASYRVAGPVRKLVVDLFNQYGKLEFARQLIDTLQEVFAEVDELAERIAEDARALNKIAEKRAQRARIKIETLVEKIRAAADEQVSDSILAPMVNQLIQAIKNLDTIAQSTEGPPIAISVRKLALDLFNKHDKLDFSQRLTEVLQRVFAEVGELAERLAEDASTLNKIVERRVQRVKIKIETLVEKIRAAADEQVSDSILAPMVNQLIQIIKNLDTIAQPRKSYRVVVYARALAVDLFNKYDKLDFSRQLTYTLQEVCAEIDEIAEDLVGFDLVGLEDFMRGVHELVEHLAEDARALDEIAEQCLLLIEDAKKRENEWRTEITYEADVGTFFFKNKLRISPEGIEWKGNRWDLDSITRIRWGGTRHSLNGIPTGTTYSIIFGNNFDYASIELSEEGIYSNFIDRLWRTVGVRLLTEYLEGLREGKKYRFGSTVISDDGMELERKRLFSSNDQVFCRWSELVTWNDAGVFCIRRKDDTKLKTSFSYQDEDNIHVLEAAIRMFWKRGGNRLSDLLEE